MNNITNIAQKNRKSLQQGAVLNQKPPEIVIKPNSIADALTHNGLFTIAECDAIRELADGHW